MVSWGRNVFVPGIRSSPYPCARLARKNRWYTVIPVVVMMMVVVVVACPAPRHNHAYVFHYSATSVSCRRRAMRTSRYVACINYNVALHARVARAKEIGFPACTVKRNYAPATSVKNVADDYNATYSKHTRLCVKRHRALSTTSRTCHRW